MTTGQALEAFLRNERPRSSDTVAFVRRTAPHDQPTGVDAIRRIVRYAFRRVDIQHGRGHALRHTAACRIVNQGGSIKEVADVLRHQSLNTSLIYAKVDHGVCLASRFRELVVQQERPRQLAGQGRAVPG